MNIRLVSLVGSHVEVLPFMLEHYREQGVNAFTIHVHVPTPDDPLGDEVRGIVDRSGCGLGSVRVGDWRTFVLDAWRETMLEHPDDWWILADQDELHHFGDSLVPILAYCDRHGYDHIRGGFVDRLSADGDFPLVDPARPLAQQFPVGGMLSAAVLEANSVKVVAAKGRVAVNIGHHHAESGAGCPITDIFVQVHHFKWTAGVTERQRTRAATFRQRNLPQWIESARFVDYCEAHGGRIDMRDRRLKLAPCRPAYPYWHDYVRSVAPIIAAARDSR